MLKNTTLTFIFTLFAALLFAQNAQTIRGVLLDKQSETPLIGATVQVVGSQPLIGAVSDENGEYVLKNVPLGRQQIMISYIGYNTATIPNVVVNAGKEVVLNVNLEETVTKLAEVVIKGDVPKDRSINELATISARQFNVEEVQRFSGGRNDVSRLAMNFAGVAVANDSRNDIVIRGNSPTGLLWRLEGIPIPNPNHFSTFGTTGGPVSALNPNMIRNSDFLTSAFPAEYGNANAGVFDIGFRNGNKEKYEFTAQLAAFSGFEAMVEGPIRDKKGSVLFAYRHSFVELAHAAGLNIGTKSVPAYKDFSFNVDFGQTKFGRFNLFGIGAVSNVDFLGKDLSEQDFFAEKNQDAYAKSRLGIVGLKHNYLINNSSYIKTSISASNAGNKYDEYKDRDGELKKHVTDVSDFTTAYRLTSTYNKKYNAKWALRTGIVFQNLNVDSKTRAYDFTNTWQQFRNFDDGVNLTELFAQTQYKPSDKITIVSGLHGQYLDLSKQAVVEPRVAFNYHVTPRQTVNFGYGLHHQITPMNLLFYERTMSDGTINKQNAALDFSRSQHFVLGYDVKPSNDWHAKVELYTQLLQKVPVDVVTNSFSVLNVGADFSYYTNLLENKGTGLNYGTELTVEKFFSQGWYMLATTSLFKSTYKGSDGIERNTAFAGNYVANALIGKEFKFGKNRQNAFTLDTRLTTAGGRPYTPIDVVASKFAGREIYDNTKAFSERYDAYFRWDFKIGYTLNSKKRKVTQQFFLDFQNVTNHKNIFQKRYSFERNELYNVYQIGFLPDLLWRFQF
jgi:hypothetical protein